MGTRTAMPRTALARAASRKTRELPRTTLASIVVVSRCVNPAERLASEVARSGHLDRLGRAQMATSSAPKRPRQFRTKLRLSFMHFRTAPDRRPSSSRFHRESSESSGSERHFSMSLSSAQPPPVTARARVRRHRAPRGIAVRASSSSSSSTDGADLSRRDLLSSGASVAPPPDKRRASRHPHRPSLPPRR